MPTLTALYFGITPCMVKAYEAMKCGLSKDELARYCGVKPSTAYRYAYLVKKFVEAGHSVSEIRYINVNMSR